MEAAGDAFDGAAHDGGVGDVAVDEFHRRRQVVALAR